MEQTPLVALALTQIAIAALLATTFRKVRRIDL
jgi:hypothetical protein